MAITVDPAVYYTAAKQLTDLADRVDTTVDTLTTALQSCGGMAGSYDSVRSWAGDYDQRAETVIESTRDLATAIGHFGYLLGCAGYNHDLANYNANISTTKGSPPQPPTPERPAPELCYVENPPSMGGAGSGLSTDIPGLLSKIGVPVPDGDTDKLAAAEAAWQTFINSDALNEAEDLSLLGIVRFEHIQSPEVPDICDHLGTLAAAAKQIVRAGNQLRIDCQDHADALNDLRSKLTNLLHILEAMLAVDIVVGVFATLLTAGISDEAATAAGAAEVTETAEGMNAAITGGRLAILLRKVWNGAKDLLAIKRLLDTIKNLRKEDTGENEPAPTGQRQKPQQPSAQPAGVKPGWRSRPADNGNGVVWQDPSATGNADQLRIMDPSADPRYPNGYVRFYYEHGQPVGLNGKPGPKPATHIPRDPDGSYPLPTGW